MDLLLSLKHAAQNPFLNSSKRLLKQAARHRVILWSSQNQNQLKALLRGHIEAWQLEELAKESIVKFSSAELVTWVLQPKLHKTALETLGHNARLEPSSQGIARDLCGQWFMSKNISGQVDFEFHSSSDDEVRGALIGLGLAQYKFLNAVKAKDSEVRWNIKKSKGALSLKIMNEAVATFTAMNMARHLTNMPAGSSQPKELVSVLGDFFKNRKNLKINIFDTAKLKKEKMGLLVGVGQGSRDGAQMIHLRYRPSGSNNKKPLAFVGKGVIFDTGGLDIKTSAGMRLMKKDMAGAAAVAGLCHFVSALGLKQSCDFYLPLAENAISSESTRPGDVHVSRSGHLVEIDNTDAEGRLVMADAIDYAVTQTGSDAPAALYNISTLTGAMRVALGLDVAGYFSNSDSLAKEIDKSSQAAGEYAWRMPLLQKYQKQLTSQFADFKNSSESGYGGAIVAALFLEKFVQKTPWVHFDVMSWNMSSDGAVSDGANAQCVQILSNMLLNKG